MNSDNGNAIATTAPESPAYPDHEIATVFPLMEGPDFEQLVADIRDHGLRESVWLYEGAVLDGRNRLRACRIAGVAPSFKPYEGTEPLAFVVSANLHRRHLDASQRAMLAAELLPRLEAEAKERQGTRTDLGAEHSDKITGKSPGESREQAAAMAGVSPTYVSDAKTIKAQAPDLAQDVREGKLTISKAKRLVKSRLPINRHKKPAPYRKRSPSRRTGHRLSQNGEPATTLPTINYALYSCGKLSEVVARLYDSHAITDFAEEFVTGSHGFDGPQLESLLSFLSALHKAVEDHCDRQPS